MISIDPLSLVPSSVVVIVDDQTPPEGYIKVDVDLNRGTIRGASIYLYYKANENPSDQDRKTAIQELAVEYGIESITPYGWYKVNVDLNSQGLDSAEGFGEPTFLFYRRAYSGEGMLDKRDAKYNCFNTQMESSRESTTS